MKKNYEKPMMYAETFSLVEHISKDCSLGYGITVTPREGNTTCSYNDNGLVLFADENGACGSSFNPLMDDDWAGYVANVKNTGLTQCYNAFKGLGNAFAS